jgi:DNA-binding MarR family transcriptional regulator
MRFSRNWMAAYTYEYRVTPARFDMLIVIGQEARGVAQNVLRGVLDVCASVVSRMLESLEDLGYVLRYEHPADRRVNWIELTPTGRAILTEITKELLLDGVAEHCVRAVLARNPADEAGTERFLARTRRFFAHLRQRVFDGSTLAYPAYLASGARDPAHPYRRSDHVFVPL